MRWLLIAAILLAGCRSTAPERLDVIYAAANTDLLALNLTRAEQTASHGVARARERRDLLYEWKFRLIRAETRVKSSRSGLAMEDLRQTMPKTPELAPLLPRKLFLEGRATINLEGLDKGEAV